MEQDPTVLANIAKLKIELSKSHEWGGVTVSLLNGQKIPTDRKSNLALSLLDLSLNHHFGIHVLIANNNFGSALALFRPQMEAYLCGAWYGNCATDDQVKQFLAGKEPLGPGDMIKALESTPLFASGVLSRSKKMIWNDFCDYTHGGIGQVKGRNSPDGIDDNFNHEYIASMLVTSASLSLLSCCSSAQVIGSTPLAIQLKDEYFRIFGRREAE